MLPFVIAPGELPFKKLDYLFFPGIKEAVENKTENIKGYALSDSGVKEFSVTLGELTDEERKIILTGCLINYNRSH
jgi:aconitate hydratase